jgi:hypothetical protein
MSPEHGSTLGSTSREWWPRQPLFEKLPQPCDPAVCMLESSIWLIGGGTSSVRPASHAQIVARTQAVYYRDSRGVEPVD